MAGIYIHIPFCKTRCVYCDFYSTTDQQVWKERYIDALCKELRMRAPYLKSEPIHTLYFGGGTPSQLLPGDFERIFGTIGSVYGLAQCRETTLEANPDDLTDEYVRALSRLPFNRLSIGVQTFDDRQLKRLHRRHTAQQALRAFDTCRKLGFGNISIDLMYGLPGETADEWEKDLETAISLGADHISAYHLIYEEGTPLWKLREAHRVQETDEETSVTFFSRLIDRLTSAGYMHYEISNFCRPGMHSLHNSSYWNRTNYLGCGPSAHSFDGTSRQWNVSSLQPYIIGIENNSPDIQREILGPETRYNDFVLTSLRTVWGLPLAELRAQFGEKLYRYCLRNAQAYLDSGKLTVDDEHIWRTREGLFVSDGIMSDLLWVD